MRLQQLFPRIVAADYEQPRRVTEECRHLLKRMLTPDPAKRVTIPEIMQHPWCAPASASCRKHWSSNIRFLHALQCSTRQWCRSLNRKPVVTQVLDKLGSGHGGAEQSPGSEGGASSAAEGGGD